MGGQCGASVAARHLNHVIVGRGDADRRDACLNGLIGERVARKGLARLRHPKQVGRARLQRTRGEHVAKRERHIGIFFPHGFQLFEVKARAAERGVQFVGREREGREERVPGIKQHRAPPHHRGKGAPVAEGEERGLVRGQFVQHQSAAQGVEAERLGQAVGRGCRPFALAVEAREERFALEIIKAGFSSAQVGGLRGVIAEKVVAKRYFGICCRGNHRRDAHAREFCRETVGGAHAEAAGKGLRLLRAGIVQIDAREGGRRFSHGRIAREGETAVVGAVAHGGCTHADAARHDIAQLGFLRRWGREGKRAAIHAAQHRAAA